MRGTVFRIETKKKIKSFSNEIENKDKMGKCSINLCQNERFLFMLPQPSETRQKWLDFILASGREVHDNVLYRVCENHFLPIDFKQCEKRRKLKTGAVPSIMNPLVS